MRVGVQLAERGGGGEEGSVWVYRARGTCRTLVRSLPPLPLALIDAEKPPCTMPLNTPTKPTAPVPFAIVWFARVYSTSATSARIGGGKFQSRLRPWKMVPAGCTTTCGKTRSQ